MIHAYNEMYLSDAMNNLGEAFDYAVNACNIDIQTFLNLFISSGYASYYEKGISQIISGMSGTELVIEVLTKVGLIQNFPHQQVSYEYNKEYWSGYILAYYQYKTRKSFKNINNFISMNEIIKLYPTLHEASEDKCVDTFDNIIKQKTLSSKLQYRRKQLSLSQSQLAKKANINLRTLQQYESKAKNINKASVTTLISLADTLNCDITDLLDNYIS